MHIPEDRHWLAKYRWLLVLALLIIITGFTLLVAVGLFNSDDSSESDLIFATVENGEFEKMVSSYGSLKAKQQRTLISRSDGTLIEIRKRPGEQVDADSVVLVLSNPELVSAVRSARLDLQRAKADFAALEADLLDQKLTMENERRLLQAEISTKRAELEAQEILAKKSIISELDLRKAQMQLHQLELKLQLAIERESSADKAFKAKRSSGRLAVEQAQYVLQVEQEKQQALNVTAGIDGVLQSQSDNLALGQWIRAGDSLGIVSGVDDLFAELNVNAAEASSVQLGMPVTLNIRGRSVMAEVVRVAPNAEQNQVQVDANIVDTLPDIARANLDIRGDIIITRQSNGRVLNRPSHYQPGKPLSLYVNSSGNEYHLKHINVLEASQNQLLLNKALKAGTRVLLNNPTTWQGQQHITLEQ